MTLRYAWQVNSHLSKGGLPAPFLKQPHCSRKWSASLKCGLHLIHLRLCPPLAPGWVHGTCQSICQHVRGKGKDGRRQAQPSQRSPAPTGPSPRSLHVPPCRAHPTQCPPASPCSHAPSVPTARSGCTLCLYTNFSSSTIWMETMIWAMMINRSPVGKRRGPG